MVLLPCSSCCQTPCACPTCACCQCITWQDFFDYYSDGSTGYYLKPQDDLSLYDGLYRAGVCNLTRWHQSQQACVDALLPEWSANAAENCLEQCGNDQECYDQCYEQEINNLTLDGGPCGEIYFSGTLNGWSAPLIDGQPATPAVLEELCPSGANPPDFIGDGLTHYDGTPYFTGTGTPDIHKLVFKAGSSTGDPIADALFVRGTRNDLPALPWQEADDCGSCANPPAYEYDCDPDTDSKRFYIKTVDWEYTHPSSGDPQSPQCPANSVDPLGFCPPINCKEVTITVTRTDKCNSPAVVTTWKAIVYVCPCVTFPSLGIDSATGDLWQAAYGYDSEAECIADWDNAHCIGDQWKQVRHEIDGENRELMTQACCPAGYYGGTC